MTDMLSTEELNESIQALDYRAMGREAYGRSVSQMENQWRAYLRETYFPAGTTDAQFSAVYAYAWQEGHASGYNEVEHHLTEVLDVVLAWERA